ncbi:MAG: tRNA (adenosine(37)-N6)-threonylcarbamoyltransferase complex ATPase subunit type 1 TsaE [Candidatus Gracilibacteria bacterium]|nr:tRNA (adenosine(37)-N6)-threonylcarbamoyltransferase complex ATPase subunit type 1 TsaE [Candidatus Gracilibacteria bacterium]
MQYQLSELSQLPIDLQTGDIVFLRGNLGTGKTTLTQELLTRQGIDRSLIKSPTYTYFQKYTSPSTHQTYFHFDLYRIEEYDVFLNIGGEEYLMDPMAIKFVEWPELLEHTFTPDIEIQLSDTGAGETRDIQVTYTAEGRKSGNIN